MECIAHRGFAGINPENTLPAVRDAFERADGVEVDVRRCGSGDLVVCHDATVDRVTLATGRVADFTRAELARQSVEGTHAGIPALEEVLAAAPPDTTLHAELKETDLVGDALALFDEAPCPVHVSSFHESALAAVDAARESADAVPTAYLTKNPGDPESLVRTAERLGCGTVSPRHSACTDALVERVHEAGLNVNAWTVTDPAETRRLRSAGVDRVITDFPSCCPSRVRE